MSVVSSERESPRLLGPAAGELVLRIRGPVRNGQVVRLASQKCTVGSASNCTLRLRLPGVREVHCVILRGATGTIVRRWSPDTRLNGAAFNDARLKIGDRLAIGPLEFEVLADGGSWLPPGLTAANEAKPEKVEKRSISRRLEAAVAQSSQRARRLIEKLEGARRSVKSLEGLAAARQVQLAAFADRLTQLEARARVAEGCPANVPAVNTSSTPATAIAPPADERLTFIVQAVGELQAEMARERIDRQDVAARLRDELATARQAWEQASDRLSNWTAPPAVPTQVVVQDASALAAPAAPAAEIEQQMAELEARSRELEARAAELDQRAEQLRGGEQELEQQREHSQRALADRQQEIEREALRLENRREEITVRQQLWEEMHSHEKRETENEPSQTQTVEGAAEEAVAKTGPSAESAPVLMEEAGVEPDASTTGEIAASEPASAIEPSVLAADETEYESEFVRAMRMCGADFTPPVSTTPAGLTAADVAEPSESPVEANEASDPVSPEVEEHLRRIRELMSEPTVSEKTASDEPQWNEPVADASPSVETEPESDLPPALDSKARASYLNEQNEQTEPIAESEPVGQYEATPEAESAPAETHSSSEGDEESIEAYMARLLKRVQGEPNEAPRPQSVASLRASMGIQANADNKPAPAPAAPPTPEIGRVMDASEFVPRAKAPERTSNLEAMRALANHSARSAIENSNKRKGGQEGVFKLLYATTSALLGLGLMAWLGWTSILGIIAGGSGLVLGGLWAMQGLFIQQQAATPELEQPAIPAVVPPQADSVPADEVEAAAENL